MREFIYTSPTWDYAAQCATADGFRVGSSEWMQRIRVLLPLVKEDERDGRKQSYLEDLLASNSKTDEMQAPSARTQC